jgi:CzcA family heavy metal efflux pump
LPALDVPVVNIITHLPGASSQDVDLLITRPIEAAMRSINGVRRVATTSAQGISQISVQFDWGMAVNDARQLVQAKLGQVFSILPHGVVPRLEQIGTTLQEVSGYTITSPSDPVALYNTVRYRLLPRLKQLPGVSRIDLLGGEQRAFIVRIKPQSLMRLHLSLADIAAALKDANQVDVAGFAHDGGREWVVRSDSRIRSLDDLRHIVIRIPSTSMTQAIKQPILLGDIAQVSQGRVPKHYTIHGDGKPAVALLVRKQPGASALDVVRQVDAELARLQSLLPAGATVQKFYDQSEIIARAKNEIVQDLWLGAALVVLVLYLFLGSIRPTLVVALTIPVTLMGTLAIMSALGLSLNIVTMTALALAIGMIVDDAIIVAENIARHAHDPGKTPEQIALHGAVAIAGPDTSGTMTTLAAFLPLLMIGGIAALFMRPFGWTVCAALMVSLILSLIFVPSLSASRWFASTAPIPDRVHRMQTRVQNIFTLALAHRKTVMAIAVLFVIVAAYLAVGGRASLLPPMDEGSILVEYTMPPGTSLRESDRIGNRLEQIAMQQPDVASVYRRTGSPLIGYQIEGVNRGELMIKLKPLNQRSRSADAIMDDFRHLYAPFTSMSFLFHHPTQEKMDESFSGLPALFGVTIYGEDNNRLIELAGRVEQMLKQQPDISNIVNNTKVRSNQLTVHLRPASLALYGLRATDVRQALRAAGLGLQATTVIRAQQTIPILLRWQGAMIAYPEAVAKLPVPTPDGGWVALNRLADIEPVGVAAAVTRLNGQRQITLLAEAEGNLMSVSRAIQKKLDQLKLPAGYSAAVSGQYPVLIHTLIEFILTALAAIALIYLIMVLQFSSWTQPLAVLAVIPVALAGGLIAVTLSGHGIDASIAMGGLTLIGIAVNNGIVLVDYANRQIRSGVRETDAWQQAIHIRLRPIMMTAATTIASLLPIALGIGGASEIFQPFSFMVIGGLLAAMAGTLLLLPVLQRQNKTIVLPLG